MWEKVLIRLAALYWASGVVFLFLAGRMFKDFVRRKVCRSKPAAVRNRHSLSPNHRGAGRFNALIRLHERN